MSMQALKDALSNDMNEFLQESRWESHVKEAVSELLEYKPDRPLVHLYEKFSLRQKTELLPKSHAFINDLSFYAGKIDPLVLSLPQCRTRLLSIIVEKHQQSKVKKTDALKVCLIILSDIAGQKEVKDYILKKVQIDGEEYFTVNKLTDLVLRTIITQRCLSELILMQELVEMKGQTLQMCNLTHLLSQVPDNQSINKKMDIIQVVTSMPQDAKLNQPVLLRSIVDHLFGIALD